MNILGVVASSRLVISTPIQAYESIQSTKLTATQAAITFSSIPQTYKHLQIRWSGGCGDDYLYLSSNLGNLGKQARLSWYGGQFYNNMNGSQDGTYGVELHFGGIGASNPGVGIIDIVDYSSTTKKKMGYSRLVRCYTPDSQYTVNNIIFINFGDSTSAITSLTFQANPAYPLINGMTVSLYGIKG